MWSCCSGRWRAWGRVWTEKRLLFDRNGGGMFFRKTDGTLMLCIHCPEKWGEEHSLFLRVEDDGKVRLHPVARDADALGNLVVVEALGDKAEDFLLPIGDGRRQPLLGDCVGDFLRDELLSAHNSAYCVDERFAGAVLDDGAKYAGVEGRRRTARQGLRERVGREGRER